MNESLTQYQCFKRVRAGKIEFIQPTSPSGFTITVTTGDGRAIIDIDPAYMQKHKPEVGGYFVQYEDGYQSYSPARAFEEGYLSVIQIPTEPKNLADAIKSAINKFSAENRSNTPDFILADFLGQSLDVLNDAINARDKWNGN